MSKRFSAAFAVLALAAAGCESTQDRSARIGSQGPSVKEKGLVIDEESRDVEVGKTAVLSDENGTAVVVELENESNKALKNVPIAIDVVDAAAKSVYRNDVPGLDASLTSVALVRPGESLAWVNDQVQAAGTVTKTTAVIGAKTDAVEDFPKIRVTPGSLVEDPVSGIEATGYVYNDSKIEQRRLVVYCVARKGGKVVAAGRSVIQKVRPERRGRYHVFFIGNPRGAKLEMAAPPTVFE